MPLDTGRIGDARLALLLLGLHDGDRVWKSSDWDALNRRYEKRFISNPVGRAQSVAMRPGGKATADVLLQSFFEQAP